MTRLLVATTISLAVLAVPAIAQLDNTKAPIVIGHYHLNVTSVEAHKKFFGKGKEAGSASGLVDPHAAGLMRAALDCGLKLDVESDYVPKWLIGLEKP